jgi:hypothetical protein
MGSRESDAGWGISHWSIGNVDTIYIVVLQVIKQRKCKIKLPGEKILSQSYWHVIRVLPKRTHQTRMTNHK